METPPSSRWLLLLLNQLTLDKDIDLITDDPLAIEHHVECSECTLRKKAFLCRLQVGP
jgi:hypothetical protein